MASWATQAAIYRATRGLVGSATEEYTPVWPTRVLDPTHPLAPTGTPSVPRTRVAGSGTIVEVGSYPGPSAEFVLFNRWRQEKNGYSITVYAGVQGTNHDPERKQGIVFVEVVPAPPDDGSDGVLPSSGHLTPQRVGGVRILDAVGELLTLRAEEGQLFYFSIATRQFVST